MDGNVLEAIALFMVAAVTGIVGYFLNRNSQKDFYETREDIYSTRTDIDHTRADIDHTRTDIQTARNTIEPIIQTTDRNVISLLNLTKNEIQKKETLEGVGFSVPNIIKGIEDLSNEVQLLKNKHEKESKEIEELQQENKQLRQQLFQYQQRYQRDER